MALALRLPFTYSVPHVDRQAPGLSPVRHEIPPVLRAHVAGRRVAIVNDAVCAADVPLSAGGL